jgi:hypothetical protein
MTVADSSTLSLQQYRDSLLSEIEKISLDIDPESRNYLMALGGRSNGAMAFDLYLNRDFPELRKEVLTVIAHAMTALKVIDDRDSAKGSSKN